MQAKSHNEIVNDYKFTIDGIIYGSFVKLDRLADIVYNAFSNSSIATATELNIFIDLYSVLHQIFSDNYRSMYVNYTDITSCVINMCAHYRYYFRKLSVNTTFFLVYSANCCDINRKFVSGYNENFYQKSKIPEIKKVVDDNFKLLSTLCPYLPDIHFIASQENFEVGVIIANLIESLNDGKPNMIISKDMYPLQLTSLYPYTTFLYPRKSKQYGDISTLISISEKPGYREEFWTLIRDMRRIKAPKLFEISPLNYSLFLAMNMFTDRGMHALYNISHAINLIYEITNGEDVKININQLYSNTLAQKYNIPAIEARYNAIDIPAILPYYKQSKECKEIKLLNLRDDGAINQINSKYFAANPIDVLKL